MQTKPKYDLELDSVHDLIHQCATSINPWRANHLLVINF